MPDKLKKEIVKSYNLQDEYAFGQRVIFSAMNEDEIYVPSSDTYVPLKYAALEDGTVLFNYAPQFWDLAHYLHAAFGDGLFTKATLDRLYSGAVDILDGMSLSPFLKNGEREKFLYIYGHDDASRIPCSRILPSTHILREEIEYRNITGTYHGLPSGQLFFGTQDEDGSLVSIAGTNAQIKIYPDIEVVDIGVGTAVGHRRKGYAVSNVCALSLSLLERGHEVKYCCNSKNTGSLSTAKCCGFVPVAREKSLWCVNK